MNNIQHRIYFCQWDSEERNWFTTWVSNPRPTKLCYVARGQFVNCVYHKNAQQFRRSGLPRIVSCIRAVQATMTVLVLFQKIRRLDTDALLAKKHRTATQNDRQGSVNEAYLLNKFNAFETKLLS